ncbi:MAG: DUF6472 family protein [Clostridium fessum]
MRQLCYDDDYGYYLCEADLDGRDGGIFKQQRFVCPYYQTDDEYKIVQSRCKKLHRKLHKMKVNKMRFMIECEDKQHLMS